MRKKFSISDVYIYLLMIFIYVPIVLVIAYSFNSSRTGASWSGFTLYWYKDMFVDRNLKDSLMTSLEVALLSTFISAVIGTIGAVSMNNLNSNLRTVVSGLSQAPLIVPEVIMGVALLLFFAASPLNFGIPTLVLSHTTFCIPYIIIMVNIRLEAIDPSVMEAAKDLGASKWQVFQTITLPLIAPGIATGSLLAIAMSMDDIIISFFLAGPQDTTLPVRIYSMLKRGVTPKINALCTLMMLFTFIVVGVMQVAALKKKED